MKIKYVGSSDQVSLTPDDGGVTFRHGEPVEVDTKLAKRLLEQSTFQKAEPPAKKGRGTAARASDDVESR